MNERIVIGGDLQLTNAIEGDCTLHSVVDGSPGEFFPVYPPDYTGPTSVTPSADQQVLQTEGLMLPENIIINPIPSNYGLITWNGSTLTVS